MTYFYTIRPCPFVLFPFHFDHCLSSTPLEMQRLSEWTSNTSEEKVNWCEYEKCKQGIDPLSIPNEAPQFPS